MSESTAIKGIRRAAKARNRADATKAKATEELRSYCKAAQDAEVLLSSHLSGIYAKSIHCVAF